MRVVVNRDVLDRGHRRRCRARPHGANVCLGLGLFALSIALFLPRPGHAADRIILRNLDVISDQPVNGFDPDGIRLANARTITWDQVESGRVAADRQADFDRMLSELGSHLYRIRRRLDTGDYAGLLSHAEAMYPRYAERSSPTAYMVFQSLMWARLAVGRREAALEPYLRCYEYLHEAGKTGASVTLPGRRRLRVDMKTGLSSELPPVWFDVEQAKQALQPVAHVISQMSKPRPPGARIYYATLALTAGRPELARQVLNDLEGLDTLKNIVGAQTDLVAGNPTAAASRLAAVWKQLPTNEQPLALYWLGRARLAAHDPETQQLGMLDLLRIGAVHGRTDPDLAAAGLYDVMQQLARQGDVTGSIAVRRELLDRYGRTWHATLVRKETGTKKEAR